MYRCILNLNRYERSSNEQVYTVAFYEDSAEEMEMFFTEFKEFVHKEYRKLKMAHLTIPDYLYDDVVIDIRSSPAVDSITHEILIESHAYGWERSKISASKFSSGKFEGDGAGVLIFIIDSGIDDHPEFESRIDRNLSRGFGERDVTDSYADSYDCQGLSHGTKVSYAVMRCGSGGASSATIEEAMAHIYEKMQSDLSEKKIVVNLSNGPSMPAEASVSSLRIEEEISNAGGIVIRAGGNKASDACDYGQAGRDNSLSIGSTNVEDYKSSFSNYGSCIDLYAPGESVYTTDSSENGDYSTTYATVS
eukprot:Awhi_evm1s11600